MQKNNTINYIKLAVILVAIFTISYSTYSIVRMYDNFVAEQQKIGFDKGYAEASKELKVSNIKSN